MFLTHIDVWVEELGPGVAGQHVDDDDLPPLLHVDQEVTQLPVVLVDQVDALRTHLLKSHDNASCHQLQHIYSHTTGGDVGIILPCVRRVHVICEDYYPFILKLHLKLNKKPVNGD